MSKYKVLAVSTKTYANGTKTMWEATLSGDDGQHDKVGLFDSVTIGQDVEGEFYTNDKGYPAFKAQKKSTGYTNNGGARPAFGARPEDPKKSRSIAWQGFAKIAGEIVIHNSKFQTLTITQVIDTIAKTTDMLIAEHDKRIEAFSPAVSTALPAPVQPVAVKTPTVAEIGPEDFIGVEPATDAMFDGF